MKQVLLVAVCLFFILGTAFVGSAQVNVSISVPPPPPLAFPAPPDVVVVPSESTDVYLVPNTVGLYFFGGAWYRFHEDHWFRSGIYNGPWVYVDAPRIPRAVAAIPPDYILGVPPGYHRIHYGDFHSHWRDWGHNHYWGRQPWYREHAEHHWGGREFHRSVEAHHEVHHDDVHHNDVHHDAHHADIHHTGDDHHGKESTDKGGKGASSTVGTGTKTVTGTRTVSGTKTTTGTKTVSGSGTRTVTRTTTTGTRTVTSNTSGGGHSGGNANNTRSNATHSEKHR